MIKIRFEIIDTENEDSLIGGITEEIFSDLDELLFWIVQDYALSLEKEI